MKQLNSDIHVWVLALLTIIQLLGLLIVHSSEAVNIINVK